MLLFGLVFAAMVGVENALELSPTATTASSELNGNTGVGKAFDSNFTTAIASESVFISGAEGRPYITMDFGATYVFSQVTITNVEDGCCSDLLHNYLLEVYVNDPDSTSGEDPQYCGVIGQPSVAATANVTIVCRGTPTGQYMRLTKTFVVDATDYLQAVEIVVEGEAPSCPCNFLSLTNDECLYVSDVKGSYAEAAEYCDIIGGQLYEIRSDPLEAEVIAILLAQVFDRIHGSSSSSSFSGSSGSSGSSSWRLERRHYWIGEHQLYDGSLFRHMNGDHTTGDLAQFDSACHATNISANAAEDCGLLFYVPDDYSLDYDRCTKDHYFICSRPMGRALITNI